MKKTQKATKKLAHIKETVAVLGIGDKPKANCPTDSLTTELITE